MQDGGGTNQDLFLIFLKVRRGEKIERSVRGK